MPDVLIVSAGSILTVSFILTVASTWWCRKQAHKAKLARLEHVTMLLEGQCEAAYKLWEIAMVQPKLADRIGAARCNLALWQELVRAAKGESDV